MAIASLQARLEREQAHAAATFRLDDALGTQHGLSWADFVLLQRASNDVEGVCEAHLATTLGLLRSRLLMRARPLEKLGLISRTDQAGAHAIKLTPAGRRVLREASETAAAVCSELPRANDEVTDC